MATAFAEERVQDGQLHVQRTREGGIAYIAIYGIAKALALKGWEVIAAQEAIVLKGRHPAPLDTSAAAPERIIIWPPSKSIIPVRKKAKVGDAALDGPPAEDEPAKAAKGGKRRGGVKYVTPLKSLELKTKVAKALPADVSSSEELSDESSSSNCSAPDGKEKKKALAKAKPKSKPKGLAKGKAKAKAKSKVLAKGKVVKLSKLCGGLGGAGAGAPGALPGGGPGGPGAPGGGAAGAPAAPTAPGAAGAGGGPGGHGGGGHGGGGPGGAAGPHAKAGDNFIDRWGPLSLFNHKAGGVVVRWKKEDGLKGQ